MKTNESISQRRQKTKQESFLEHFKKSGIIMASAEAAGVSRQIVYHWINTSPSFEKRMREAEKVAETNRANLVLRQLSIGANEGNRKMQNLIRTHYGEKALQKVKRGKILTWEEMQG